MPSKDKRKKIQKRLSKVRRSERKDKKKKRTKNRSSSRNSLYREYSYQRKSRRASYLLVLFIILLLVAVGVIVYFFVIIPKLDNKSKCAKNEVEDCQKNKYLDKEKCECLPCEVPNPGCSSNEYYDPNNLPYCRNSTKYTTDKDGNKKKMYAWQPCPTGPDGKKVNQCGGGEYDINNASNNNKSCVRIVTPDNDSKKDGLSFNTILLIISGCLLLVIIIMYSIPAIYHYRRHGNKKNYDKKYLKPNPNQFSTKLTGVEISNNNGIFRPARKIK